MAIFTPGGGVSAISGSVGGTTFSRNRGGPYMRTRAIPVNPNTSYQQLIRGLMAQLSNRWVNILTAAQREAWDSYALNVPLPNPLGENRNVGGLGMYIRSNIPRQQLSLGLIDTAPVIFDLGDYVPPSVASVSASADTIDVSFSAGDAWCSEDDAAMLIYTARPQNQSINFFKGPYRVAGAILGNSTTPPTSPATVNLAFVVETDHRVFARFNVTRADGRLGSDFRASGIAT